MSLSPSPALGPCGIPEELELPALEPVDVAAGAWDALEDFEVDDPPPHPASAMAATASRSAINRRVEIKLVVISFPFLVIWTAPTGDSFPRPMPP